MTIQYKNVKYRFDTGLWSACCAVAVKRHGLSDIAEMIGVDEATVKGWIKGHYKMGFEHPSMNKFINLCGLLDVDPGQFFTIQDGE